MGNRIKELEEKLSSLELMKEYLESEMSRIINNAISQVAESKKLNRMGKFCFVVKFSEMCGHPWSPDYYDWVQSAQVVRRYLKNKEIAKWKSLLQRKLNNTNPGKEVIFEFVSGSGYWRTSEKIPISRDFIKEIINQLD